MMPVFALAAALMICCALAFILLPLRRTTASESAEASRQQTNLALYRHRLEDLQQECAQGEIDAATLAALKLELERDLLADMSTTAQENSIATSTSSLSDLSDRSEPDGKARTVFHDFAAHSGPMQREIGEKWTALPTGAVDQSQVRQAASLWSRHWLVLLSAGLLPLLALLLYGRLGAMDQLELARLGERLTQTPINSSEFPALQDRLASQLKPAANQLPGWYLLASSALQNGRLDLASSTLQQIAKLNGDSAENAPVYAQLAQIAFQQAGQKITPQIESWINQALALDPDEPTALGILGIAAFARDDFQAAIDAWQRALTNAPPGASTDALHSGINVARERLGLPAEQPATSRIEVSVEIDPALLAEIPADSTLFVFARAANGPPMPLAATRLDVGSWPREVLLDDSMAMQPNLKLSLFGQIEVVARISRSGSAQAAPGDLEGRSGVIERAQQHGKLKLLINQRR